MEVSTMKKELIQPIAGGMAVGAIVVLIIIFSAGWVVTQSSAREQSEKMVEETVLGKLVPICVAQFQQDPNKDQKLKELRAKNSYERGDYVEKQGWATMPASKEPEKLICDKCADRILESVNKGK